MKPQRVTVKCLDGIVRSWKMTLFRKLLSHMRGGWFTIRGMRYHIDTTKFEVRGWRPFFPWIGLVEKYERILYYHEGHEEPFTWSQPEPKGNARNIQVAAEASYARNMIPQQTPWILIAIIMLAFLGLGALGVIAGR